MSAQEQAIPIEATAIDDWLDAEMEQAVRAHSRTVYRIAYAVLRNSEDAEDAAQEAFIRLLRARRRSKLVREPKAWLARTVWRLAISRRRGTRDVPIDELGAAVSKLRVAGASPEEIARNQQMVELLDALIAGLPPELREPLQLSTAGELTSAEIGAALGIPEGTVRTRLMRARETLKTKIEIILRRQAGGQQSRRSPPASGQAPTGGTASG